MVTIDDIAASVTTALQADSGFAAAVPGNAWFDRAPDTPASYPYAVYTLEATGDPEFSSDGTYLQEWILRLGAYTRQGTDHPATVQAAIAACLNASPTGLLDLGDGGAVLHILPAAWDGEFDPQLRQGVDVFAAKGQWTILIEGTIS